MDELCSIVRVYCICFICLSVDGPLLVNLKKKNTLPVKKACGSYSFAHVLFPDPRVVWLVGKYNFKNGVSHVD